MLVTSVRTLRRRLCSSVSSIELIKDYTNKETSIRTISCSRAAANDEDVVAAASCSSSESLGYIAKIENGPSASSSVAVLRNNNSNILRRRRLGNRRNKERSSTKDTDAIELALDSVVKIFTVASSPNYFLPWQNKSQRETMGSGSLLQLLYTPHFFFHLPIFQIILTHTPVNLLLLKLKEPYSLNHQGIQSENFIAAHRERAIVPTKTKPQLDPNLVP